VELDGEFVVLRHHLLDLARPGLSFEYRLAPAEALHLADQLARASRAQTFAGIEVVAEPSAPRNVPIFTEYRPSPSPQGPP
jgi:hypothetical protein